jgi:hypothetical protein
MLSLLPKEVAAVTHIRALFAALLAVALVAAPACSDGESGSVPTGEVALRPITEGVDAEGSARLVGHGDATRLELRVKGLPPLDGAYEVWLYNSIADAVGVAQVARGSFELRVRLPLDRARYRFIDISQEPLDDNPNHSGASVLRVRTSRLR